MSESRPRPAAPMWILLATLLGGAFLVQRGNQPAVISDAPPPPAPSAELDTVDPDGIARMRAPLREFLGLPSKPSAAPKPPVPLSANNESDDLARRIKNNVGLLEFLVVMVADPIETATNYRFDLQLDTLH